LLTISPIEGTELFMIAGTLFALCLIPIAATRTIQPAPLARSSIPLRAVLRASPIGSSVCLAAGIVSGSLLSLAPIFVTAHASIGRVATFMAALILGGMLLQYPIGHLSDRFDRQRLIIAVSSLLAATTVVAWWVAELPFPSLSLTALALGGLTFTLYPLGVAQITDRVRGQSFVAITSVVLLIWGVGAASGPVLVGQLMVVTGVDGLLLAIGGIAALLALTTLVLRADPLPPSEQSGFCSMTATTPVLAGLDPRTEPDDPQLDWVDEVSARTSTANQ
jgi:MFS family permease